ncbi:type II toxin-antitoxin system RelE/ParE family toxin [Labrys okinawensis]|uniref:type II toxin-antitoxin system RelE/ParE family toxin n=1 Tax=Labrys okinawensis TaxID=346911 RepID=UPI0039BD7096
MRVDYSPEAIGQLQDLERKIALAGSPMAAARFVDEIFNYCDGFATFPKRGPA